MFRSSYSSHHCLVLTDGFYEWKMAGTRKQPYHFAGGDNETEPITFAILTTRPTR